MALRDSEAGLYLIVAIIVTTGAAIGTGIILTLRRQWYRAWPWPVRWAFIGVAGVLACLGAVTWFGVWAERWGWMTAAWLIGFPFAFHLWEALPPRGPSSTTE